MFRELLSEAVVRGSRSTALKPLLTAIGLILVTIVSIVGVTSKWGLNFPVWVITTLVGILVLIVFIFLCAYVFLLFKDPEALRSESFILRKMEIERGAIGDNIHGEITKGRQNLKKLPATDPNNGDNGAA